MQDRMQSESRVLGSLYQGVFGSLFPLFRFAANAFSRRERGYEISDQIMAAFAALRPKYLAAVAGNMARILGLPPDHPRAQAMAMRALRQHSRAWVDFVLFGQRPPEEALRHFARIEGEAHLEAALAEGRGVILLTAHLGNYELGGLLLRARGLSLHTVYKPDRFEAVERLRTELRTRSGVVGIPVGEGFATLPLVKVLREGGLAGLQGDRDFSMNGLPVPFFGREAPFPRGPWELAAMTGAPVVPAYFFTDEDHRFHARFEPPIWVSGERGARMASMEAGLRAYVEGLEALVRERPDQWYCFYPFWDDPARQGTAG